jgi:hypothetical protein
MCSTHLRVQHPGAQHTADILQLLLRLTLTTGWCQNTAHGTVKGSAQGPAEKLEVSIFFR